MTTADGARVGEVSEYLGERTNNQAEYAALKLALLEAMKLGARRVAIKADSELMVKQLNGEYRVKNAGIKPLYSEIMAMLAKLEGWTAEHVRREYNKDADQLANEAIDNHAL